MKVSPARAIPATTVTIARTAATAGRLANWPTVRSVREIDANVRIAVSTSGLNSGPGPANGSRTKAAANNGTTARAFSAPPTPSSASPLNAQRSTGLTRQRLRPSPAATPAPATAAAGGVPMLTASAPTDEAPIAASSQERRSGQPYRSTTSATVPASARTQAATDNS